jgi:acetyltransferase-like isoleucine patch superfamily enzyme
MRFTTPSINNDYYDEDYLKVFRFKTIGKNVKVHRSVVFMDPSKVSIGSNVEIRPYCVFGTGLTLIPDDMIIEPFGYFAGEVIQEKADADRIKELEALLQAKEDAEKLKHVR